MTHFAGLVIASSQKLRAIERSGMGSAFASDGGAAFTAVNALVAPYQEGDEWGEDGTRYDWFQLGGRFTGLLDSYDPTTDERNFEWCEFCEGTGVTTQAVADKYPAYQKHVGEPCIQCARGYDGVDKPIPGRKLKWSTQWATYDGDIKPMAEIDMDRLRFVPGVVVTPDGEWHEHYRMGLFASHLPREDGSEDPGEEEWAREVSRLIEKYRDGHTAIVVDFHV